MTRFLIIGATALALTAGSASADSYMDVATQSGVCGSGAVTSATMGATGSLLVTCGDPVGVTQDFSLQRLRNRLNGGAGGAAGGAAAGGVTAFGGLAVQLGLSLGLALGSVAAGNAAGGATPNTTN